MPKAASLLDCRFLHSVDWWGKGPLHTLSWALSSLPVPCAVSHPTLSELSWPLPPVLPRIERAAKQRPPIQLRKPPCVWLCPSLSRAHGQGPRLSLLLPSWLCPGALGQVLLQVQGGEGRDHPGCGPLHPGNCKNSIGISCGRVSLVLLGSGWGEMWGWLTMLPEVSLLSSLPIAGIALSLILSSRRVRVCVLSELLSNSAHPQLSLVRCGNPGSLLLESYTSTFF